MKSTTKPGMPMLSLLSAVFGRVVRACQPPATTELQLKPVPRAPRLDPSTGSDVQGLLALLLRVEQLARLFRRGRKLQCLRKTYIHIAFRHCDGCDV